MPACEDVVATGAKRKKARALAARMEFPATLHPRRLPCTKAVRHDSQPDSGNLPRYTVEELKEMASAEAARRVKPGMRLGLGTGSTMACFLRRLAERIGRGELPGVVGVPTSMRTKEEASGLGIPLAPAGEVGRPDLVVDGADEVAPDLGLVKGLGGALLREKVVAQAAGRMLVIVDETKLVGRLGERAPLPVEAVPFGIAGQMRWLEDLGARPALRKDADGRPLRTDNGHVVVDCWFDGGIEDPARVDRRIAGRAGLVESGLFLGLAEEALVAGRGGVRRMRRSGPQ